MANLTSPDTAEQIGRYREYVRLKTTDIGLVSK